MRFSSTSAATAGGRWRSRTSSSPCRRELDGRVLLVATGQQELTADATLQKIQDRFTVKVVLKNQDVDAVVRRVLLNKEPAAALDA